MAHLVAGLFTNSDRAGKAVAELNNAGFTEDISVIAKDEDTGKVSDHQVKQEVSDGAAGGAVTGGILGALAGLIAGLSSVVVPGLGALVIAGPLTALWGVTGGALGALGGGLVGALVDAGIPEERAKLFEDRIKAGDVLVTVTAPHERETEAQKILAKHQAAEQATYHQAI